jgi:kumamolisin
MRPYLRPHITSSAASSYFNANQIASIYQFPAPNPATNVTVAVISFGGGLFGNVDLSGVLTGGDVQTYWTSIGIAPANQPKVIIIPVDGAVNAPLPNDKGTTENTIDVSMIGACCPSAKLTIQLYIGPNTFAEFNNIVTTAIAATPAVILITWGAAEIYYTLAQLTALNALFQSASVQGINICTATGDNGSNDGVGGTGKYVDFPSSSPYVVACGGTNLKCPSGIYDATTVETAWSGSGGGVSMVFPRPAYQSQLLYVGRCVPDLALNADPKTGVCFLIGALRQVIGGTSIVASAIAGYLACINPNGFITPQLYSVPLSCYHDITSGSNGAYTAYTGYDVVTGFGSIVGSALTAALTVATIPVTSVVLSPASFTILTGGSRQLIASVVPSTASNKVVSFASSNSGVATVNSVGVVTGVAPGSAVITVTTVDENYTAIATVIVVHPSVAVISVTLNTATLVLVRGHTAQLVANVTPPGASNRFVLFSSSNTSVAVVGPSGLVTAIGSGVAVVTCTTVSGEKTATVAVTVTLS